MKTYLIELNEVTFQPACSVNNLIFMFTIWQNSKLSEILSE